jgi:hypothetical protein
MKAYIQCATIILDEPTTRCAHVHFDKGYLSLQGSPEALAQFARSVAEAVAGAMDVSPEAMQRYREQQTRNTLGLPDPEEQHKLAEAGVPY